MRIFPELKYAPEFSPSRRGGLHIVQFIKHPQGFLLAQSILKTPLGLSLSAEHCLNHPLGFRDRSIENFRGIYDGFPGQKQ